MLVIEAGILAHKHIHTHNSVESLLINAQVLDITVHITRAMLYCLRMNQITTEYINIMKTCSI